MKKLRKKRLGYDAYGGSRAGALYAYELDADLVPNTGWVMDFNQRFSNALDETWQDVKGAVSHIFQDTKNGVAPATGGALVVQATGRLLSAPAGVATERAVACFNCHAEQVVDIALNFVAAAPDCTRVDSTKSGN